MDGESLMSTGYSDVDALAASIHDAKMEVGLAPSNQPFEDCGGLCLKEAQAAIVHLNQDHKMFIVKGEWLDAVRAGL